MSTIYRRLLKLLNDAACRRRNRITTTLPNIIPTSSANVVSASKPTTDTVVKQPQVGTSIVPPETGSKTAQMSHKKPEEVPHKLHVSQPMGPSKMLPKKSEGLLGNLLRARSISGMPARRRGPTL